MTGPAPIGAPGYFEEIHREHEDPFGLFDRPYERRKRAVALGLLPKERYRRVFEPGCSVGAFTLELARRADEVVAFDASSTAVTTASGHLRSRGIRNAVVAEGSVPEEWPEGHFDLVVVGELAYYLGHDALDAVRARIHKTLAPGGHLLAIHFRPPISNCELDGDAAHALLGAGSGLMWLCGYEEPLFRVGVWEAPGGGGLPRP